MSPWFRIAQVNAVAVALHHACYGPEPEPNSPGYQTLWPNFVNDASVAVSTLMAMAVA